jgi:hypothetical protein
VIVRVSPLAYSLVAFALMFGGMLLGMVLRTRLPRHHLSDESKDAVKVGTALIATLTALVLGLLIASAKGSYDTLNNELGYISAKIIQLDSALADYGPEARETRDYLRSGVISAIQRLWPEERDALMVAKARQPSGALRDLRNNLLQLSPRNDAQRWLQSRALQVNAEIADTRWLLVQQTGKSSLPNLARLLLTFWLTFLFFSFGLFSPRNAMVITVFVICALSAAGSILLILELDQPYQGLLKISSEPLRQALAHLGQ